MLLQDFRAVTILDFGHLRFCKTSKKNKKPLPLLLLHPIDNREMLVYCEGFVRIKRKNGLTSSSRYAVLRGNTLTLFHSKDEAVSASRRIEDFMEIESGCINSRVENGFDAITKQGRVLQCRVLTKADLARWLTAFHQLAIENEMSRDAPNQKRSRHSPSICIPNHEVSPSAVDDFEMMTPPEEVVAEGSPGKRRVSFNGSVHVRLIPMVSDEDVQKLFYNKDEMRRFSAQAESIICRTGEVMSCAIHSMRRSTRTRQVS